MGWCRMRAAPRKAQQRAGAATPSSSERLEPHAYALAKGRVLPACLFERQLVGRLRLRRLALRHQYIALEGSELGIVGGRVRRVRRLPRLRIRLLVQQHRGEAKAREVAEVVRGRAVDRP